MASAATTIPLADEAATAALGAALAKLLRPRDIVALHGTLGAGKTTLARGLIRALAGDAALSVPSPTFTLVEIYDTPAGPLWHFDLYRLNHADEAWELGIEQGFAEAICLIEWPERLGALLPGNRLDLSLKIDGDARRAILSGDDAWLRRVRGLNT
ncbi:MAG: tRNA (adenosine(37)-N6)-threonylcarbamoyltransferase complex ATPase subunit type 1 TsaE [Rhodospirillales bacterium]